MWKFREFNELPHVFDERINKSYSPAIDYLQSFTSLYVSITARCVAYISGSLVAVLLVASVLDEAILLYVHIGDHNLIWYLGICSAIFAASRSIAPEDGKIITADEQNEMVDRISAWTHYRPDHWEGRAASSEVISSQ